MISIDIHSTSDLIIDVPKHLRLAGPFPHLLCTVRSQSGSSSTRPGGCARNDLIAAIEGVRGVALVIEIRRTQRLRIARMVGRTHEARLDVTHWIHRILVSGTGKTWEDCDHLETMEF
jgi:hypothetical protein